MPDCVGKPFTSQELWRCLVKYLTPVGWRKADRASRMRDDKEFKRKLMERFLKNNKDRYDEITLAIDSGDIKLAHRLTHTLRSNAGQLRKTELQKAAGKVERMLEDGTNLATTEHLHLLRTELDAVISELAQILEAQSEPQQASDERLSGDDLRALVESLEPLLEDGDPQCLDYIDRLRLLQGSDLLIHYIEDFEFDKAAEELIKLIEENS
jgi:HPt (histidine-containing phosphotransfer) domain-containing protein